MRSMCRDAGPATVKVRKPGLKRVEGGAHEGGRKPGKRGKMKGRRAAE